MKFQLIIDRHTEQIISTEIAKGKAHDLTIFKETTIPYIHPLILIIGDSGYRGLQKFHGRALLPIRHKADIAKLTQRQQFTRKARNKKIASIRMKIEHVIGQVKVFKIVSEKYRNGRKRLLLRFNLICGIVNYEKGLGLGLG